MILSFFSLLFIVLGVVLVFCWEAYFNSMFHKELTLANDGTQQYKNWIETPIDINFEAYLFNWTNSDEFQELQKKHKKNLPKLKFEQIGPFHYAERHTRSNVVFNANYTISFNTVRKWIFDSVKTNLSLDTEITAVNPIALAVANVVKDQPYLIQRGVHYFFQEENVTLAKTKTVREFMFDGYYDMLIEVALKLNIRGYEIPWDKFGWFYDRNMSEYYDGNYTMWTGEDDIAKTGIVTVWDENPKSVDYEGQCSEINGTTGEVWGPVPEDAETVSMFISDTCSKLTLERNGTQTVNGIKGNKYIATEKLFDNGTKYKENACFSPGEPVPSGVRNISECKFKAPAFISLPHFYLADEYYRNAVEGMKPDPENHSLYLVIEPNTGLPLHVQASVQCNLRMYQVDGIDMFANVEDTMVPMIWLKVTAKIPDNDVFLLKFALAAPTIGLIVGYVLIVLGISLLSWSIYRRKNNSKKANVFDKNI